MIIRERGESSFLAARSRIAAAGENGGIPVAPHIANAGRNATPW